MNCETGFLHSIGLRWAPGVYEDPRGARHWVHFRVTDLFAVGSVNPDHDAVMRIGGEAPGGGPILSRSASSARFEYGFPPPRLVNSAVVLNPARAPKMVLSGMLVRIKL